MLALPDRERCLGVEVAKATSAEEVYKIDSA